MAFWCRTLGEIKIAQLSQGHLSPRLGLLFDEVTSALDPEVTGEVKNIIRNLVTEHNLTMLMVTHQMGFARDISDRVCFFFNGKIEEAGTPDELFNNPQKARTQQFLSAVRESL